MLKETKSNRQLYTLNELLAGMPENLSPLTEEEREWLNVRAVGKEYPNGYPDEEEWLQTWRS